MARRRRAGPWVLYGLGLLPAVWLFYLGASGGLGFNPVKELEHRLGLWALRFLIASLAITPIRDLSGLNLMRYRRALGLLAFYYALAHVAVYASLDIRLDIGAIAADILRRPYITIGFIAVVIMLPLAVTSHDGAIRRLGRNWGRLHRLAYLAAAAAAIHYLLAVKAATLVPLTHIGLVVMLLAYRPLRRFVLQWKRSGAISSAQHQNHLRRSSRSSDR